jgi:hypothetical protein
MYMRVLALLSEAPRLVDSPLGWPAARIQGYFLWSAQVVEQCRGVNTLLEAKLDALLVATFSLDGVVHPCMPLGNAEALLSAYYAEMVCC